MKNLTSNELRDFYCAPQNTDDIEDIDFDEDESKDEEN
jgi:hypothetical protein